MLEATLPAIRIECIKRAKLQSIAAKLEITESEAIRKAVSLWINKHFKKIKKGR